MIVEAKTPGFQAQEIIAHTEGEFIDVTHREFSWYWDDDLDLGNLAQAWRALVLTGYTTAEGVTFEVLH